MTDPATQRQVSLGLGNYRARRAADKIVLHAGGETPTPNYKAWLRRAADAEAADYELWWMARLVMGGIRRFPESAGINRQGLGPGRELGTLERLLPGAMVAHR